MKLIKKGSVNQSIAVFIENSSVSTGAGLTGLVFNSAGLVAYYWRAGANAPVSITLATLALITTAWASGGFKEMDATNMPGWYRLDVPDAVLASGVDLAYVSLKGATNMKPVNVEVQLVAIDAQDTVRLGLTALPNAVVNAAGGLHTIGTGAGQIQVDGNGHAYADVREFLGTAVALVGGVPNVNVLTEDAAVATQNATSVWAAVLDTFSTAAAALTTTATAKQIMSIMLSYAAGRTTNSGNTLKTPDNVSTRITATTAANERTAISLTPST